MADTLVTANERSTAIQLLDGVDRLIGSLCKSVIMATGLALLFAILVANARPNSAPL